METSASVTLHDVAREAQVSLATASRALNGSTRKVADSYRDRVLAAAEKLGYTPNLSAQAVARGRTNTIGLLVGDIADPYFSSIAAGAMSVAAESGLVVTMAVTGRESDRELEIVRAMRGQRPRAMILAGSRFSDATREQDLVAELQKFQASGGRVVFVSQHSLPFTTVQLDNYGAARKLGAALSARGYRRVGIVAGPDNLITSRDRVRGFADGLAENGVELDPKNLVNADFSRDGGFTGTTELISRQPNELDLIFAASDVMAMGALSGLRASGIEPGTQIGVAGFDDIPTVQDVMPPLTTVAVALEDLGRRALELALREEPDEAGAIVGGSIVIRESTPKHI